MEYYVEIKLRGDVHKGGFSNGLSLCGSQSTQELVKYSETEQAINYENAHHHHITVNFQKRLDALEVSTTFDNRGSKAATLELLSSFAIEGVNADKIHRLQTFWSEEGKLRTETISELHMEPSWNKCGVRVEKFGSIGSMPVRKYFPFIALENSKTNEFIAIQLYAPSSWQMELICQKDNTLAVVGGIADRDFGHWFKTIEVGEQFTTTKALIATGNSLYEVCDKLVKAQNPDISKVDEDMGIMFNEYCTTWGNPSFENVKKISDQLKDKGIKYFIIDSGWNGSNADWWNSMGDWEIDRQKFPDGLKSTADYIRQCGMIPGLWFEVESVGVSAKNYTNTDHLLKKDGEPLSVGDRRYWDMCDPWVIDHLTKSIILLLKESGFGYIKIDYNDSIGIGCDGAESLGEGLRQRIQATQDFFNKIKREIPDIIVENCSSGGHRLEPSFLELTSQSSFSDAHEITSIPIIAANLHRVMKPSQSQIWAVIRETDSKKRLYYSIVNTFLGRMCLSGDVLNLTAEQWNIIKEGTHFYHQISDIVKYGKTIRYENEIVSYNKPTGEQIVVRELDNKLLIIAHRFEDSKDVDLEFMKDYHVLAEYGEIDSDFTAKAWLVEKNKFNP